MFIIYIVYFYSLLQLMYIITKFDLITYNEIFTLTLPNFDRVLLMDFYFKSLFPTHTYIECYFGT